MWGRLLNKEKDLISNNKEDIELCLMLGLAKG
jgi:hypothetical protein